MTRAARHRTDTNTEIPNTLDGDITYYGLTRAQANHYESRLFHQHWAHQAHDGERWALLYWAAGWCPIAVGAIAILAWLLA